MTGTIIIAEETAFGSEETSAATEESSASIEELSASAQGLIELSKQMLNSVNKFKLST